MLLLHIVKESVHELGGWVEPVHAVVVAEGEGTAVVIGQVQMHIIEDCYPYCFYLEKSCGKQKTDNEIHF
jgi:hypothetical protein